MPTLLICFLESTDAHPPSPPFPPFVLHVSLNSARLFDWQQLACQSQGKSERRGLGSKKWRRDTRRRQEWEIEKDISNSKRHAVFPWQLGFHRNGLAKDAISVKKIPTYTLLHCMLTNIGTCLFFTHQDCVCSYSHERRHTWVSSCIFLLTHLRSTITAQLQATYVGSSIIG